MGFVWEMQRRWRMCGCVKVSCLLRVFSSKACCCWAHRCFFQKWGKLSWEKEGNQVHVLEAHRVWVAPHCPLNKITAFTRPLCFLWECNTINKRGGCFYFFFLLAKKTTTQYRNAGTFFSEPTHSPIQSLQREIYLRENIADNISFSCRWKPM